MKILFGLIPLSLVLFVAGLLYADCDYQLTPLNPDPCAGAGNPSCAGSNGCNNGCNSVTKFSNITIYSALDVGQGNGKTIGGTHDDCFQTIPCHPQAKLDFRCNLGLCWIPEQFTYCQFCIPGTPGNWSQVGNFAVKDECGGS